MRPGAHDATADQGWRRGLGLELWRVLEHLFARKRTASRPTVTGLGG